MLLLEFIDRLEAQTCPRLMGHEIKDGAAVAGHDNGLAAFNLPRQRGQAVLASRIDTVVMQRMWPQVAKLST
jgi:hypothetical protein